MLGWGDPIPDEPSAMHWSTYERIADNRNAVSARGAFAFPQFGERLGVPVAETFGVTTRRGAFRLRACLNGSRCESSS